jgi:hemerythrin HHE cation binding domain-containing protein
MPNSLEEAASKTMGTIKVVKATVKGLSGVFKRLMQEHGEVSTLMKRVSLSSDESVRRELYPTIRKELLSHEKGELSAVYPVLSQHTETLEIAEEHAREASELDAAIKVLDTLDFSGAEWAPAFEHLFMLVKRHVDEEESKFFPKAQETIGEQEAKALESRYEAAKDAALTDVD